MNKKELLLLFYFTQAFWGSAVSAAGWKIQAGGMVTNVEKRWSVPSQFASKVSEIQGVLGVSRNFKLIKRIDLKPELFVLVPWRKGADGTTLTFTTHLGLQLEVPISKAWFLTFGNGLLWESYCSKGEEVTLGNGTGSSVYYTPSRWTQIILPTGLLGVEWKFSKRVGAQLAALVPEYLNPQKRRFHGLFKVSIDL